MRVYCPVLFCTETAPPSECLGRKGGVILRDYQFFFFFFYWGLNADSWLLLLLNFMPCWHWTHESYIVPSALTVLADCWNIFQHQINELVLADEILPVCSWLVKLLDDPGRGHHRMWSSHQTWHWMTPSTSGKWHHNILTSWNCVPLSQLHSSTRLFLTRWHELSKFEQCKTVGTKWMRFCF